MFFRNYNEFCLGIKNFLYNHLGVIEGRSDTKVNILFNAKVLTKIIKVNTLFVQVLSSDRTSEWFLFWDVHAVLKRILVIKK